MEYTGPPRSPEEVSQFITGRTGSVGSLRKRVERHGAHRNHPGEHSHRREHRHGNVPRDHAPPQQVDESAQQGRSGHLAQRTGDVAQQHLLHADGAGTRQPLLHGRQRRGARQDVERAVHGQRPGGHLHRIGDQQEHASHQRGVEGVLAQAAEGHFGDGDGHEGAHHDDPPGNRRRKVEGKQHARHYGRPVADGSRTADHEFLNQVLDHHARHHGKGRNAQHVQSEDHRRHDQRGHQRDHDVAHDPGRRLGRLHVGCGSHNEFISHIYTVFSFTF